VKLSIQSSESGIAENSPSRLCALSDNPLPESALGLGTVLDYYESTAAGEDGTVLIQCAHFH
jgi:hypothetical protein